MTYIKISTAMSTQITSRFGPDSSLLKSIIEVNLNATDRDRRALHVMFHEHTGNL